MTDSTPAFAKYSTAVIGEFRSEILPEEPKSPENWPRKEIMASPSQIAKIFEGLALKCSAGEIDQEGVKKRDIVPDVVSVYWDFEDQNSLLIVASSEGRANDYARENGLRIPYHEEKSRSRGVGRFGGGYRTF